MSNFDAVDFLDGFLDDAKQIFGPHWLVVDPKSSLEGFEGSQWIMLAGIPYYKLTLKVTPDEMAQIGQVQMFDPGMRYLELDFASLEDVKRIIDNGIFDQLYRVEDNPFLESKLSSESEKERLQKQIDEDVDDLKTAFLAMPDDDALTRYRIELLKRVALPRNQPESNSTPLVNYFGEEMRYFSLRGVLIREFVDNFEALWVVSAIPYPKLCFSDYFSTFFIDSEWYVEIINLAEMSSQAVSKLVDISTLGYISSMTYAYTPVSRDKLYMMNALKTAELTIRQKAPFSRRVGRNMFKFDRIYDYHLAFKSIAHQHTDYKDTRALYITALRNVLHQFPKFDRVAVAELLAHIVILEYETRINLRVPDHLVDGLMENHQTSNTFWLEPEESKPLFLAMGLPEFVGAGPKPEVFRGLYQDEHGTKKILGLVCVIRRAPEWKVEADAVRMCDVPFYVILPNDYSPPNPEDYKTGLLLYTTPDSVLLDVAYEYPIFDVAVGRRTKAKLLNARQKRETVTFSQRESMLIELGDILQIMAGESDRQYENTRIILEFVLQRCISLLSDTQDPKYLNSRAIAYQNCLIPWEPGAKTPLHAVAGTGVDVDTKKPWLNMSYQFVMDNIRDAYSLEVRRMIKFLEPPYGPQEEKRIVSRTDVSMFGALGIWTHKSGVEFILHAYEGARHWGRSSIEDAAQLEGDLRRWAQTPLPHAYNISLCMRRLAFSTLVIPDVDGNTPSEREDNGMKKVFTIVDNSDVPEGNRKLFIL